jgi:SAM-dependent methyltransferase
MKSASIKCLMILFFVTVFSAGTTAAATPDVPYVPTPENVVQKMLEMVNVGKDDLVYDLGCGDGRIVIAAVQESGARGVCVDISEERINESRWNAKRAEVSDRIEFLNQDLFETDFSQASVVTLYLLPSVNIRLRPKLLSELKPGTRVVSHAFDMGDWEHDRFEKVDGREIYFWIIPANVSGIWQWGYAEGDEQGQLELKQSFQKVDGTLVTNGEARAIQDAKLKGDRLEFTVEQYINGSYGQVRYEARVEGEQMQGRRIVQKGEKSKSSWRAQRNPDTMQPMDGLQHFGAR